MKKQGLFLIVVVFVLLLTACGGQTQATFEPGVDASAPVKESSDIEAGDTVECLVGYYKSYSFKEQAVVF